MFGKALRKPLVIAAAAAAGLAAVESQATTINGAGASFPAPVYRVWTYNYQKAAGTRVNYQSVGSGAGIAQIKAKTVNFGGSDAPMTKEELDKEGLVQFPMLMGGVVVVVNLPGVNAAEMKLSQEVLADIFLGKIKNWSDERIKADNPGVNLPDLNITAVHRSDGSGTTWIFTNYLAKVSKAWSEGPGFGSSVRWPVGVGGQKNPGVALNVKKINGSIGYVEYTYAVEAKLDSVMLKNKDGKYIKPDMDSFQAAGANADWKNAPGFHMVLTDQPGATSWPITGVTYILMHKDQPDKALAAEMLKYFSWCFKEGAAAAKRLEYVPMPDNVVEIVKAMWDKELNIK